MKKNPSDWPEYTDDPKEFELYRLPNRMPRLNAPVDVPLPFDRRNVNRNYMQIFGNSKEASDRIHHAKSVFSDNFKTRVQNALYWPGRMDIVLGAPPSGFERAWAALQMITGRRPHPICGTIISNSTIDLLKGEGYAQMIFASVWERHWWPIIEFTAWKYDQVLFHRLLPSRNLYSGSQYEKWNRSATEQIIQQQIYDIPFNTDP